MSCGRRWSLLGVLGGVGLLLVVGWFGLVGWLVGRWLVVDGGWRRLVVAVGRGRVPVGWRRLASVGVVVALVGDRCCWLLQVGVGCWLV